MSHMGINLRWVSPIHSHLQENPGQAMRRLLDCFAIVLCGFAILILLAWALLITLDWKALYSVCAKAVRLRVRALAGFLGV
jgi:hypothetical protein